MTIDSQKSIRDFIDQMKNVTILPEFLVFLNKPNGLEFMRVDPETKQIKYHIRINHDLSITVICSNYEEITMDTKITALDDVYTYLKSVEKWPVCVGTMIDIKKYSKNCKGVVVGCESYRRMQMNPRCQSCRYLRNELLTRKSAVSSFLEKSIACKSQARNIKKKCKRLKTANISFWYGNRTRSKTNILFSDA
ncbi:uncharacterized protein LOC123273979 isoform X1 [Cotesia glomerata]|uniref:uncharacterized protein LOC123273979 isoform X1 n=1 Tax=Cotesia glomerata TaxID=32391 RepID=UPI001D01BC4E|nr:uncharacterized protein LOC123273979 isoform X1 [Cotesia glomerata]XP_044597412.1 uncharacterized protein LOC123273979 isoform X1 [Cotesia glomerata]